MCTLDKQYAMLKLIIELHDAILESVPKADAYALAAAGADVVLTDIDPNGQQIADDVAAKTGAKTAFYQQDVGDEDRWNEIIGLIEQDFGGLNVLVRTSLNLSGLKKDFMDK